MTNSPAKTVIITGASYCSHAVREMNEALTR